MLHQSRTQLGITSQTPAASLRCRRTMSLCSGPSLSQLTPRTAAPPTPAACAGRSPPLLQPPPRPDDHRKPPRLICPVSHHHLQLLCSRHTQRTALGTPTIPPWLSAPLCHWASSPTSLSLSATPSLCPLFAISISFIYLFLDNEIFIKPHKAE